MTTRKDSEVALSNAVCGWQLQKYTQILPRDICTCCKVRARLHAHELRYGPSRLCDTSALLICGHCTVGLSIAGDPRTVSHSGRGSKCEGGGGNYRGQQEE